VALVAEDAGDRAASEGLVSGARIALAEARRFRRDPAVEVRLGKTQNDQLNGSDGDQDAWDVIAEIPDGSAAALVLLEHRWAVPLRDAVVAAGGFRISDGFISPLDLIEIGVLTAEEAREQHAAETATVGAR
jgi:hypothetical protein